MDESKEPGVAVDDVMPPLPVPSMPVPRAGAGVEEVEVAPWWWARRPGGAAPAGAPAAGAAVAPAAVAAAAASRLACRLWRRSIISSTNAGSDMLLAMLVAAEERRSRS